MDHWHGGRRHGKCGCTSPTPSTTPGGRLTVAYVAVYQQAGDSTAATKATAADPREP